MSTIANKFQVGTAACAIAAAATLTPAIAQAAPAAPLTPISGAPVLQTMGNSALGSIDFWRLGNSSNSAVNNSVTTNSVPNRGPLYPIFHNRLLWIGGTPNPTPPASTRPVFQVYPLNVVPGFLRPFLGWFENLNAQVCIAGFSVKVGPYGTVTGTVGRGC
jgi:hypothetical protein